MQAYPIIGSWTLVRLEQRVKMRAIKLDNEPSYFDWSFDLPLLSRSYSSLTELWVTYSDSILSGGQKRLSIDTLSSSLLGNSELQVGDDLFTASLYLYCRYLDV